MIDESRTDQPRADLAPAYEIDRRTFMATLSAFAAAGPASYASIATTDARPAAKRLPIAFSTLGCPSWPWERIIDVADANGFAAIELRGLETVMDLPKHPVFAPDRLARTRDDLAKRGLKIVCLGASSNLHEMDADTHAAQIDEAIRFIDLAQSLGAPYVRVFGNVFPPNVPREAVLKHVAQGLRELGDYAGSRNVTVLLESHGDFTDSPTLVDLMRRVDSSAVAILWDAHHTYVSAHENPDDTARQLMRWVRHTHLKDSVPAEKDRRYVLTGKGEVPVRAQFGALARSGYKGYYSFEWEKRWHPEIEEPEVAFADYARVAAEYLRELGVAAR